MKKSKETKKPFSKIIESNAPRAVMECFKALLPPERITTTDWANKYRFFHPSEGATQGRYKCSEIPYLTWPGNPHQALDDTKVYEVVCQKSAQVAWTTGVLGNYIGKRITHEPAPILIMFPKEGAAKSWNREKLIPMIEATPILSDLINPKAEPNTWDYKEFKGGYLKIVGSNSASSVKSSPIPIIGVEEPDDCNQNLSGQGDAITLGKERTKSFKISLGQVKLIIGGTPTRDIISAISREMELSDKRRGMVACHECEHVAPLDFDNLIIPNNEELDHPIFGKSDTDNAFYACKNCGATWTFEQKNKNLYHPKNHWLPTAEFNGIAGFYLNELYSKFEGSSFKILAEKKLTALYELNVLGKPDKWIAFMNSSIGMPYKFEGESREAHDLEEFGLDYELGTVPSGAYVLTAGVDVQEDRLELGVRAWGPGGVSYLVERKKLYGNPPDINDPVWDALGAELDRRYTVGKRDDAQIAMMSIDSGFKAENVYSFVRDRLSMGDARCIAIKGSSRDAGERPIFSRPRVIDYYAKGQETKADKWGVSVYPVGTNEAKSQIFTLLGMAGKENARYFWPRSVDEDYLKEMTSEVLAPNRANKMTWQRKAGFRAEALDCEVYAMHAGFVIDLHKYEDADWEALQAYYD